jgi:hypothetical protein
MEFGAISQIDNGFAPPTVQKAVLISIRNSCAESEGKKSQKLRVRRPRGLVETQSITHLLDA